MYVEEIWVAKNSSSSVQIVDLDVSTVVYRVKLRDVVSLTSDVE